MWFIGGIVDRVLTLRRIGQELEARLSFLQGSTFLNGLRELLWSSIPLVDPVTKALASTDWAGEQSRQQGH